METLQQVVLQVTFEARQPMVVIWTPSMQKVEVAVLVCQTLLLVHSGGEGCHAGCHGHHLKSVYLRFGSDRPGHLYHLAGV